LCRLYKVSPAGYYKWRKREPSTRDKEDARLVEKIQAIHKRSRKTYGSPRIHAELKARGERVGRKRIARLMRVDGIRGRSADLYYANPGLQAHYDAIPNCKQDLVLDGPNQLWVGDITYLKVNNRWLYLAAVMDAWSRQVVAWSLGRQKTCALTLKALNQAIRRRQPTAGLVFHSDRGAEYSAFAYRDRLASAGIVQSMNRPRRMTDNARMESFFHSMKSDVIHRVRINEDRKCEKVIRSYMMFYNTVRRHSALDYQTPANYELGIAA
jgi:putative transposase